MRYDVFMSTNTLHEAKMTVETALPFMFAGNATFTLRSLRTQVRYTFKVQKDENSDRWFVKLLTGNDNESAYSYMGMINANKQFYLTAKSNFKIDSTPVIALMWTLKKLTAGVEPQNLEMWHAGKCGRCGRKLTVPESIESGFGPECVKLMGGN